MEMSGQLYATISTHQEIIHWYLVNRKLGMSHRHQDDLKKSILLCFSWKSNLDN